jgi:hypothetical protein
MADVADVAAALVNIIAALVYPNGITQPSVTGDPILIYQGWPNPTALSADLASNKVHISVFPRPGDKTSTTISGDMDWVEQSNNGVIGVGIREVRRQTRQFQITIWASCFDHRDPLAKIADAALASISRMTFHDGSQGILTYANSLQDDSKQTAGIYRRDLIYAVNYATTQTEVEYAILQTISNVTNSPSGLTTTSTTP